MASLVTQKGNIQIKKFVSTWLEQYNIIKIQFLQYNL